MQATETCEQRGVLRRNSSAEALGRSQQASKLPIFNHPVLSSAGQPFVYQLETITQRVVYAYQTQQVLRAAECRVPSAEPSLNKYTCTGRVNARVSPLY